MQIMVETKAAMETETAAEVEAVPEVAAIMAEKLPMGAVWPRREIRRTWQSL